jgi:hypothetical protein
MEDKAESVQSIEWSHFKKFTSTLNDEYSRLDEKLSTG